jgi:hypothetical protein
VTDVEEREEQQRQELLKLYFEFFKHFTTLGAAAAVALLAVYREGVAERRLLAFSLVLFGLAVVIAVLGMVSILGRFRRGHPVRRTDFTMMMLVTTMLGGGLLSVIVQVLGVPGWVLYVGFVLALVAWGLDFYRRRESSH